MLQLTYGIWQFKVHKTPEKSSRQSGCPQIIHRNLLKKKTKKIKNVIIYNIQTSG